MEAREEAQAADTSLPEQEATALEPQPPSSSSPGESGGGRGRLGPGILAPFPTSPSSLQIHRSQFPLRTQVFTPAKWALHREVSVGCPCPLGLGEAGVEGLVWEEEMHTPAEGLESPALVAEMGRERPQWERSRPG